MDKLMVVALDAGLLFGVLEQPMVVGQAEH